ncbi:MAG: SGNH/GDSL hydrolase family protein [Candidatus Dadabacteria bacterium]
MKEHSKVNSRRTFLRDSTLATVSAFTIPQIINKAFAAEQVNKNKKITIKKDDIVLFQGDSITDAGRKRDDANFNNSAALGNGYAMIAGSGLLYKYAPKNLKVYNKGISGNKVYQLTDRWQKDCLDLKPNVLSILVGVNDFWHTLTNKYTGTIKTYHDDYKKLLETTKQNLPGVQLIIGEPYAVPGIKAVDEKWYPTFNEYRAVARELAREFDAVFIPYQSIYDNAQKQAPGVYWTGDGVHPSLAGAHLMAHTWLEIIKG